MTTSATSRTCATRQWQRQAHTVEITRCGFLDTLQSPKDDYAKSSLGSHTRSSIGSHCSTGARSRFLMSPPTHHLMRCCELIGNCEPGICSSWTRSVRLVWTVLQRLLRRDWIGASLPNDRASVSEHSAASDL